MKIIIQNPHIFGDSIISGIHDYIASFLIKYKPTIYIKPLTLTNIRHWLGYLKRKNLPFVGWDYLTMESHLNNYDIWMSFSGTASIKKYDLPTKFDGLKLFHVMDYIFDAGLAIEKLQKFGVDYLFGYSSHDLYCPFFKSHYNKYINRVIPFPFGISKRFQNITPFEMREKKASVMGAVNKIANEGIEDRVKEYAEFYKNLEWGYPLRQAIRENGSYLNDLIVSYLAPIGERVNLTYDSVKELNKYQVFINDDGIKHHPPARTYEGAACGSVMVCSDHPCYSEFGWNIGENCIGHRFADFNDMKYNLREALNDQEWLEKIQKNSLEHTEKFRHDKLADRLYNTINELYYKHDIVKLKNQFKAKIGTNKV